MPVLGFPRNERTFVIDCEASGMTIGAELSQLQEGKYCVISYSMLPLTPAQHKYCTTRKELVAIVRFTLQYQFFLLGCRFVVRMDHSSLTWLMRFKYIDRQLARWIEELSQYDIVIIHRASSNQQNADGRTRMPDNEECCDCYRAGVMVEQILCGGCKYCPRAILSGNDLRWRWTM